MSYFIRSYKDGTSPIIKKDQVFYFYRTQPLKVAASVPPVAHLYGPVADRIYFTANLIKPATLIVRSGDKVTTVDLAAGSQDEEAHFTAGLAPRFELRRSGKLIAEGIGPNSIDPSPTYRNLYCATGVVE